MKTTYGLIEKVYNLKLLIRSNTEDDNKSFIEQFNNLENDFTLDDIQDLL